MNYYILLDKDYNPSNYSIEFNNSGIVVKI